MLIPDIFYGTYKDVKRETQILVKKIIKGDDIEDLISNLQLLDTVDNSALIITDRLQISNNSKQPCFMIFMLSEEISLAGYSLNCPTNMRPSAYRKEPLSHEQKKILFLALIRYPWGLIAILSGTIPILLSYPFPQFLQERWRIDCQLFLEKLQDNWDEIFEVGNRYVHIKNKLLGINEPGPLTSSLTKLGYILCHCGLTDSEVKASLSCQDVPQLIQKSLSLLIQE